MDPHTSTIRATLSNRIDLVLPLGVSHQKFDQFLAQIRIDAPDVVIISDTESLAAYKDPFPVTTEESSDCAAVLQPMTVGEIQVIVKLASESQIPLWTISQGKNNGYGGPAPRVRGSVVLDLQRMKRILDVNDRLCTALVEPGVTFFDLFNYCKEHNLNCYPSVPSLGWGSIIGNTLDRGVGYTPLGDHSSAQCGMEVVLANGTVVRTGMGAIAESSTWQCFKGGYGPSLDTLFHQSNLGIVTKMGIWMNPKQEGFMSCSVDVEEEEDLSVLVDKLGDLYRKDILQNHPVVGNIVRHLARTGPRTLFYQGTGAIPDDVLRTLRLNAGIGFWSARFALYGSEMMMNARWEEVERAFSDVKGAALKSTKYMAKEIGKFLDHDDVPVTEAGGTQFGIPNMLRLQSIRYRGENGGHLSFSPVLPSNGKAALEFYYAAKRRSAEFGFDFHAGIHIQPRYTLLLNLLFFDNEDLQQRVAAGQCFDALLAEARVFGYSEYRAHIDWMDSVGDQYDYNDHALRKLQEQLKDALDPKGILSPGKQGIWPRRFRRARAFRVRAQL